MKKPAEVRACIREGRNSNKTWHERAKKNQKYFDGKSVSEKDKNTVERRDQKVIVINIIKPAAKLLIGLLATPNIDYDAKPMVPMGQPMGKQATWGLKQTSILNDLDITKTKVGESAIVEGVGWFLSGPRVRDLNPEVDPTQVTWVPATWCWYDLPATDPGLRNAKYIGLSQWWPVKRASKQWPKFKEELLGLRGKSIPTEGNTTEIEVLYETDDPASAAMPYIWGREEWNETDKANEFNARKDEVMIHELYYRDEELAYLYQTQDGHWHRYDPETELEVLFREDVIKFTEEMAPVIRRARMAGPYVLDDESLGSDLYPLTPFFWDRDITGAPISFVEQVSHPQEEVNVRRMRAWWEVAGQRIQVDDEWIERYGEEGLDELAEQAGRPDGIIQGTGVTPWPNDPAEHMAFVGMAKQEVTETGAVTETLRGEEVGKSPRSAESKRQSTVQAGMGFEIHRQMFAFAYKLLGRKLLRLMIDMHDTPWPALVPDEMTGESQLQMIDPDDVPYFVDVSVGPASPTMLEKQGENVLNLLAKVPPDALLQAESMLAALNDLNLPVSDGFKQALNGYIGRLKLAMEMQQMAAAAAGEPAPPLAETMPASAGAHRPRQANVGQNAARAAV